MATVLSGNGPRLSDLIRPLSESVFLEQHWSKGVPYLANSNQTLVAMLKAIPNLADPESLLAKHRRDVALLGRDSFRTRVAPKAALDFYFSGYNLYIDSIDETVPEVKYVVAQIAADLGIPSWQLHIEAFAGSAGGVSSRHYDHDVNFQILLTGRKRWRIERNSNITNPLLSCHPTRDRYGQWIGFREEAYASDRMVPTAFDEATSKTIDAPEGSTFFLPRGYWHETTSLTESWAVNVVFKGVTWATALASYIESRLHSDDRFRRYVEQIEFDNPAGTNTVQDSALFRELKSAAVAAIENAMTPSHIAIAPIGNTVFEWVSGAGARRLIVRERSFLDVPGRLEGPLPVPPEIVAPLESIVEFRYPFSLNHALARCQNEDPTVVYNILQRLIELGLVNKRLTGTQ